ncbi:hypothetical protein GUJ93_ZPchr0004g40328 [Zizania palustris]|uniref:Uncharacterized protein n=1 Tax=Zizania palustris TaxID=103762 RepID=A0A8J5SPL1_ZIZPA|nr:hypothetical protein GUJ93_ZPchr0004g40328 [Zizania palustris]
MAEASSKLVLIIDETSGVATRRRVARAAAGGRLPVPGLGHLSDVQLTDHHLLAAILVVVGVVMVDGGRDGLELAVDEAEEEEEEVLVPLLAAAAAAFFLAAFFLLASDTMAGCKG